MAAVETRATGGGRVSGESRVSGEVICGVENTGQVAREDEMQRQISPGRYVVLPQVRAETVLVPAARKAPARGGTRHTAVGGRLIAEVVEPQKGIGQASL